MTHQDAVQLETGRRAVLGSDDDYTRKYPPGEYGDEMGPDARVWKTYIDESDIADKEYISDNNATLDGILVFVSKYPPSKTALTYVQRPGIHFLSYCNNVCYSDIPVSTSGSTNNHTSHTCRTCCSPMSSSDRFSSQRYFLLLR